MGHSGAVREHLTTRDVLTVHEVIVESSRVTPPGAVAPGDIEYTVDHVREGQFGQGPETLHEKAVELLELLVANHPFVDGNKRTALASAVTFYALNRHELRYDSALKRFLVRLATARQSVDSATVRAYLEERARVGRGVGAVTAEESGPWQDIARYTTDGTEQDDDDSTRVSTTTDDKTGPEPLPPETERGRLVRRIVRYDIEAHRTLYEQLERE